MTLYIADCHIKSGREDMTSISEKLTSAIETAREEERQHLVNNREWERKWIAAEAMAQSSFLSKCRKATVEDYARWLIAYLEEGEISHVYDYNMPGRFYIAQESGAVITPLHGAGHVNVIVPKGVTVEIDDRGHSGVYLHDPLKACGSVALYKDVNDFILRLEGEKA